MKKFCSFLLLLPLSCVRPAPEEPGNIETYSFTDISASTLASVFASLPLGRQQLREVHRAVSGSSGNGYDEEYTMESLIRSPGAGVGESLAAGEDTRSEGELPLREMLRERLQELMPTRSGVEDVMDMIAASGFQLYWPFSEDWDGESYPVITFDPGYGAESNVGYALGPGPDGAVITDTLTVDEGMAMTRPVWVINSNSDAAFTPLELFAPPAAQTTTIPLHPQGTGEGSPDTPSVGTSCLRLIFEPACFRRGRS